MSLSLVVGGVTFPFPVLRETGWADEVSQWAAAISAQALYKAGGTFTLSAELDFGATAGIKALSYKSRTANVASAGQIRFARADTLKWRNVANDGDLALGVDSSNQLTFDGMPLGLSTNIFGDTSTIDITVSGVHVTADVIAGSLTDAYVNASAAIALSKLAALTASRALVSNGSGVIAVSSVTSTELGYVSGVSSAIQTQLNAKQATLSISDTSTIDLTLSSNTLSADLISGSIINSFINASAAIALSKLAAVTASRVLVSDASGFVSASSVTSTTLGFLDATSSIQTQLNTKQATLSISDTSTIDLTLSSNTLSADIISGSITNSFINASAAIALSKLAAVTASRALVSDGSGFVSASSVTATELGYLSGVTSALQTQINAVTGGGDPKLLQIYSPSGAASVDITSQITNTYDFYTIEFLLKPGNDNKELILRTSTDNGSTFDSGSNSYDWCQNSISTSGYVLGGGTHNDTLIRLRLSSTNGIGNSTGECIRGIIHFSRGSSSPSLYPLFHWELACFAENSAFNLHSVGAGGRLSAAAINAVSLFFVNVGGTTVDTMTGTVKISGSRLSV